MIKFRVYCYETQEMIVANDYEELAELFMALNADDSIFSEPMQSTGLFDKNGREVYESDIVKMLSGKLLLVEFNHGMCEPICYYTSDSFEVVGSIFENHELLEKVE